MVYSPKSYCHDAPVYTGSGDEGTCYYVCCYCGKACDARLLPSGAKTPWHRRVPWHLIPLIIAILLAVFLLSAPSVGKVPDSPPVEAAAAPLVGDGGVEKEEGEGQIVTGLSPTYRTVTAYSADEEQTDSTPCLAADGTNICFRNEIGETLCAANFVPFGTVLMLDNQEAPDGEDAIVCIVADRLSSKYPNRVDLFMGMDTDHAIRFGVKTMWVSELTFD